MKIYAVISFDLKVEIPDDINNIKDIRNYVENIELPSGYMQNSFMFKRLVNENNQRIEINH